MRENAVLTDLERHSLRIVLASVAICLLAAVVGGLFEWWLLLAVATGAIGGLVHEIAQSGGKILFIQRHEDGIYLGAVAGIVLGGIAGMLMVRGSLVPSADPNAIELTYEALIAGLALKGVIEAAGGRSPDALDRLGAGGEDRVIAGAPSALLDDPEGALPTAPPLASAPAVPAGTASDEGPPGK